ncbi:MAG: TIM barrel protein, partial [Nitratireductor sp.]
MTKFSANLGFLWSELALPDAIYKAKEAGFDAVECHWPYEYAPTKIKTALSETGLSMLSLNTTRGNVGAGDNGLAALVGREHEARHAIDEAIAYADEIDANAIHVMAGCARGEQAHDCFLKNLEYASSNTSRT